MNKQHLLKSFVTTESLFWKHEQFQIEEHKLKNKVNDLP